MPIAAHGDLDPGPVVLDAADDVLHNPGRLFSGGPLAWAQQRQGRLARGRLEDVDGLEAVLVIMGVEPRQLLATVDGIVGIVDVEDDALGNTVEAFAKQIDYGQPHARQLTPRRFITERGVPPANNGSERDIRSSTIFREVTGGFRSQWGSALYAAIRSTLNTGRRQGLAALQAIQATINDEPPLRPG